jgi:thiamine biosynthesis lipoprotein
MKSHSSEIRRARPLLGTLVEIGAVGPNAAAGIDAAFHEVETIHRLMSFHDANSDVSRINRAAPGEVVQINPRTYEVLSCAETMSVLSNGAFDITVGGKLVAKGLLPKPHGAESFAKNGSFEDVVLLPDDSVRLKRRLWIDLGGIAKGYAVDQAVMALKKCGVGSGVVNAGGDLYVFGDPQPIHIRHPDHAALVMPFGVIKDSAVASSSGCYNDRHENGVAVEPLVELRRNACLKWKRGVTVIAPRCIIADALTKVVRLAQRRAAKILTCFGAQAVVVDRRGVRCFMAPKRGGESELRGSAPVVTYAETPLTD